MSTLLDEMTQEAHAEAAAADAKREKANASYTRMVANIAAGKKPSPEERAKILTAAGKTTDELLTAITHKVRRIDLSKLLATGPAIASERVAIETKIDEARAVLNSAEDIFANSIAPHRHRLEELELASGEVSKAAEELLTTADDHDVLAEIGAIDDQLQRLSARHMRAFNVVADGDQIRGLEVHPRPDEAAYAVSRADVARLNREIAEATTRKNELTEQLLKP